MKHILSLHVYDDLTVEELDAMIAVLESRKKITSTPDEAFTRWTPVGHMDEVRTGSPLPVFESTNTGHDNNEHREAWSNPAPVKKWNPETEKWEDSTMGDVLASIPAPIPEDVTTTEDPVPFGRTESAEEEDTRPRLIPLPGRSYICRNKVVMHCKEVDEESIECHCKHGKFFYRLDGTPCGGCSPDWECVEETPF